MKNRAKCKKCNSIIESFHSEDYVTCKCTHIAVFGGDSLRCSAVDWSNFARVDDEGNEIIPTIKDTKEAVDNNVAEKTLSKQELIDALKMQYEYIDNAPVNLQYATVNNADLSAVLKVLVGIFNRL